MAVQNYCSINNCTGVDGRDGSAPTPEQIAEAVEAYCAANNDCQGPNGETGETGTQGATGPKGDTGATGPKGDTGAAGKDGTNGADGKDGRGIKAITCTADNNWEITYTDDTTTVVDGPCRIEPESSETETP